MFLLHKNWFFVSIYLINFTESASIHKNNDTLDILKSDVSQVSGALEDFTFDVLRQIIEDSGEETTTPEDARVKRSLEDSVEEQVQNLCLKRCQEEQKIETYQIKDLKKEVKKLQEVVRLLQSQQKIIDILDRDNSTSLRHDDGGDSASEELSKIKIDLKEVIDSLNQTKEIIDLQQKKDEILEQELVKQRDEIAKLKTMVVDLHKNVTNNNQTEEKQDSKRSSSRASELSGFRRLLKSLPEDDDLRAKILDLHKALIKKKKDETFDSDLKQLEQSLKDDDTGDKNLLRLIVEAMKKTQQKSRSDDLDIRDLDDLSEAINRLRPKEDDSVKFQAMLNSLVNRPVQQQVSMTPQEVVELTKRLTPTSTPYICVVEDGGVKAKGYRVPFPDYPRSQFFPGQNYFPPKGPNGFGYEKPGDYQQQNGNVGQYQEDLRQQIDGLQAAVDGLNRPEYLQRPEDKAMIDDLEKQIGDLRNVVNNLNDYQRAKRSVQDNEVENVAETLQYLNFMAEKFRNMTDDERRQELNKLHLKVAEMQQQLRPNGTTGRAAPYPPPQPQIHSLDPTSDLQRSFKNDFISEIIGKILEKIIAAIPTVVQKLFNFSLGELSKYDPQDYDVQVLSKNLGVLAFLPIILLRLLKGVGAFLGMLRKNAFVRSFLVPALILGTVAGSVLFLIWWLQPDDVNGGGQYGFGGGNANGYGYEGGNGNPQYGGNGVDPNQYSSVYQSSYNYPVYNRSYFNK